MKTLSVSTWYARMNIAAFQDCPGIPRLLAGITVTDALPLGEESWGNTSVILSTNGGSYRNIFTGEILVPADRNGSGAIRAADLFNTFPVALLEVA